MPRCKALARGGSRRCRRNALKGQEYCSIHGGGGVSPSSGKSRSRTLSYSRSGPIAPPRTTRASYPGSLNESNERSGLRGQETRRVINPAFYDLSLDNPVAQHFIADKVGDLHRSSQVAWRMKIAYNPVIAIGGTILISSGLNVLDQYRDIAHFAATGKIHGYSLVGESHS